MIRRVSGESIGTFFANNVAAPLGLEFWIGLPQSEEPRVAKLISAAYSEGAEEMRKAFFAASPLSERVFTNPAGDADLFNTRAIHGAEIPAVGGITTARSLARMYAATIGEIDGVRLLNDETVASLSTTQSRGPEMVLVGVETHFGLGFMLPSWFSPMGGPRSFGHPGAGGSVGFADPEAGVAAGYVMNKMDANLSGDPRARSLIDALYASIE